MSDRPEPLTVGLVGCGRWGRNLLRVFEERERATVGVCCHTGEAANRRWVETNYPGVPVTTEFDRAIEGVDAVAVATPIETHYELAKRALEAGVDVFVEKPLTSSAERAAELRDLAAASDRVLFVGYVFVHHPVFRRIEAIHAETPVEYARFRWGKLGGFREDAVANLASHDLALAYRLFGRRPDALEATDRVDVFGRADVASLRAAFGDARCRFEYDRLDARTRKAVTLVTASDDVYLWEDDRLSELEGADGRFRPVFEAEREPLAVEIERFLACVREGRTPITGGAFGATVTDLFDGL